MNAETRTVLARIGPDLMPLADFREESLRLAAFRYSAQVVAGSKPSFRYIDTPTHEIGAAHERSAVDAVSVRHSERRGALS